MEMSVIYGWLSKADDLSSVNIKAADSIVDAVYEYYIHTDKPFEPMIEEYMFFLIDKIATMRYGKCL